MTSLSPFSCGLPLFHKMESGFPISDLEARLRLLAVALALGVLDNISQSGFPESLTCFPPRNGNERGNDVLMCC
ncbi:hypothetical protein CEXT_12591 [Caerostris extrusa]|uniref:Uncharacterized protein n=1 Tax=Caerostris extrusa TaxID=172846 RepID=A0AAV4PAT4_CAEEX|nr:hypothetical protein CEXT_12591 [Caerostris extrusa]